MLLNVNSQIEFEPDLNIPTDNSPGTAPLIRFPYFPHQLPCFDRLSTFGAVVVHGNTSKGDSHSQIR